MDIEYRDNAKITVAAAIDLYKRSTLGERRPLDRPDIFEGMLKNANLIITAWHGERLVGISRTLTDFTYVAYLADLAINMRTGKFTVYQINQMVNKNMHASLFLIIRTGGSVLLLLETRGHS